MVMERYGPPTVRKTRNMLQADTKKNEEVVENKHSQKNEEPDKVTKENLGANNRPQLLVRQLAY